MKKFYWLFVTLGLLVGFMSFENSRADAYAPASDTWVLTWNGSNYFVKAGSLDHTNAGYDVAPEFSCDVAHNGIVKHYEFVARGITVLYVNGSYYNDSEKSRFISAMYESICDRIIYRR